MAPPTSGMESAARKIRRRLDAGALSEAAKRYVDESKPWTDYLKVPKKMKK